MKKMLFAASLALATISTAAVAAVEFYPATGTGFVGKGDVQLALGLNNAQLQTATVAFTYNSTVVSEVTWECTNSKNEKVQDRERTTTSSVQGVVAASARVKNQITGYNLNGYSESSSSGSTSEGPALNSCPDDSGNWSLTSPAGNPEIVSSTGGLFVNGVAL
ncbi:hypothetical protein [Sphingorhabdus sp.]|uniref:hypothetical protein n=1 Tax=Sphingorhabdus sp. TaxID=1902408 RepID=UPI0039197C75